MHLSWTALLAICTTPCLMIIACTQATDTGTEQTPIAITVNPSRTHPISPYIYGVNIAATIKDLPSSLTLDRVGGNRWTAYNWETNASNAGSDWHYQNDGSLNNKGGAGSAISVLVAQDQKRDMATMITVPMQGLVAADESGPVNVANPPDLTRFKKVVPEKQSISNAPFTANPPTTDDYVYVDEFLWSIDRTFTGQNIFSAKPAKQPVFVSLDNEPDLWNHTHLELQGKTAITTHSYIAKTISMATALKKRYPDVVIFGPAVSGFMGIYNWFGELKATPAGNNWFTDQYASAMNQAGAASGRPLVDIFDFHWYPEATDRNGTRITSLTSPALTDDQVQALVQSPRSLWDRSYKERSWITDSVIGEPLALLHRLQSHIHAANPDMKLAITEYNNGGGQHIAGTIAQADNLGVFGECGLFAATLWPLSPNESYILAGFRAFRNFDNANHHFGDTSVEASSTDASRVVVHVSTDSARPGRVVMVAINRSPQDQATTINGQPLSGVAHLFRMTAATAAKQSTIRPVATGTQPVAGSSMTLTLPALSVTTIDIY